ncbi:MAG TPA: hypothetical protein PKD72_12395, partial [Gemmatales bacterium]|nr:hypothetical protein [Gemmatales bacterium]
ASAGASLHAALSLPLESTSAVEIGARLKARMKEVGFKATSAIVALGHDAFMCRDIRHPDIPANELPAIVQFQAIKETTIPADDAIIDYIPIAIPLPSGEKHSLTFIVRKARVRFCEALCEAAGLKLLFVVPRALALQAGLPTKPDGEDTAGYACSNSFFVLHQGSMIFNRSMGSPYDTEEYVSELRRSVAGYDNQAHMPPLSVLRLASHQLPQDVETSLDSLRTPVEFYSPYQHVTGAERLEGAGDFAVALGAAFLPKLYKKPPVDFLEPKKVVIKPSKARPYLLVGGVAAAALALLLYGLYWMLTSSADSEIAALKDRIQIKQQKEKDYADVEKRFEAIKIWKEYELFILEELYELVNTFPDIAGVQITKAEWRSISPGNTPGSGTAAASSRFTSSKTGPMGTAPSQAQAPAKATPIKPVAKLTVKATAENDAQLKNLEASLRNSSHWKWVKSDLVPQETNTRIYELDVLPLKPEEYRNIITIGTNVTAPESSQSNRPGTRRTFRTTGGGRQ